VGLSPHGNWYRLKFLSGYYKCARSTFEPVFDDTKVCSGLARTCHGAIKRENRYFYAMVNDVRSLDDITCL
jgi:hypothetical protein